MDQRIVEIETELKALKAVRLARLTGRQVSKSGYDGRSAEFVAVSMIELNQEITRLEMEYARLTGQSRVGPVRVVMGPY